MKPVRLHRPGVPESSDPPDRLVELAGAVQDPLVVQSGVTTTGNGDWALYVTVRPDATVPIAGVERQAGGYPVVYEAQPAELPIAGPAYPNEGRPAGAGRHVPSRKRSR